MKREPVGPGQESVWDYPRPPLCERVSDAIRIVFDGKELAATASAVVVKETSHPPVYYLPPGDVDGSMLEVVRGKSSFCEWKGSAGYVDVVGPSKRAAAAGWFYAEPVARFAALKDHYAFYPSRMDACYVNDELVTAQAGDFYGGWITSKVVGPFKGAAGTWGW